MISNRRDFLKSLGAGAAALAISPSIFADSHEKRPNILFIMAENHAAHSISCYGSKINSTPSRTVILTGKYSHKNGVKTLPKAA